MVSEVAHIFGKKWSLPVFEEVAYGRFDGFNRFLERSKSMTPRILSIRLRELERAGLVKKASKPAEADVYALTERGKELQGIVLEFKKWGVRNRFAPDVCLKAPCTECPNFKG